MSKRLTALAVENAKPGTSRREISDGGHNGLHLIVQPSGHKSWAVRFRVEGEPRKLTLAAGLTLHEAREQAAAAIKEAQRGIDPTKAKKAAKQERLIAAANTFAAVAELYLDRKAKAKMRSIDQLRYRLSRLVFPQIGDKPIADLKRSQIMAALDHVEHHHGPFSADLCLSDISCNVWTLPAARNKTGVDLIRPLSKAAMAVLPKREGEFVFGNPPDRPLQSFSLLKKNLDKASGVTGWRLHDLRRTARSLMSRAGVNSDHAERCLGHVIGGIRGVYDKHQFHAEKAHALEALAHQITLIVNPPKGNVRQLKRRA